MNQEQELKKLVETRLAKLASIYEEYNILSKDANGNRIVCSCLTRSYRECNCSGCKHMTYDGKCSTLECRYFDYPNLYQCYFCNIWKISGCNYEDL